MRKVLCTVNADQVTDELKKALESALRTNYVKHISPSHKLRIIWCELPVAQGFTSYEQPCVSLVVIEAQNNLDQHVREKMLSDCAADWARVTEIPLERLMISVFDQDQFSAYLTANQQRLSPIGRLRFGLHVASSLVRSKAARGLLVFSPNLGG